MMSGLSSFWQMLNRFSLVQQIIVGLILGILLAVISPAAGLAAGILGSLFVGALKAVAPVLVFVLVMAAITQHQAGSEAHKAGITGIGPVKRGQDRTCLETVRSYRRCRQNIVPCMRKMGIRTQEG